MVATCLDAFGRLDVLVANAAVTDAQPFLDITDSRWRRVLDVNVTGTFYCLQEATRVMAPQGGGAIVVTASTNAFWVESHLGAYNTSKGGVVALVRSAALDLAPLGIRVNAVEPGVVRTRFASFVVDDPAQCGLVPQEDPPEPLRRTERRGQGHPLSGLLRRRLHHWAGPHPGWRPDPRPAL